MEKDADYFRKLFIPMMGNSGNADITIKQGELHLNFAGTDCKSGHTSSTICMSSR